MSKHTQGEPEYCPNCNQKVFEYREVDNSWICLDCKTVYTAKEQHTQGKWKVVEVTVDDKPLYFIEDEERETVCDLYHKNNNDNFFSHKQEEAKANAHLIASAPELLEAVKHAHSEMIYMHKTLKVGKVDKGNLQELKDDMKKLIDYYTNAINKAEGKE